MAKHLFSVSSLLGIFLFGSMYLLLSVFFLNYQFILDTFSQSLPFFYKIHILSILVVGIVSVFSPVDTMLFLMSALLVGINCVLGIQTFSTLKHLGKTKFSLGGITLFAFASTGCSSCGISLLSFLGIGGTFSFLPFKGLEFKIAAVILLVISGWYMSKQLHNALSCKVKK